MQEGLETLNTRDPRTKEVTSMTVVRKGDRLVERVRCASRDEALAAIALVRAEVPGFDAAARAWNTGFGNSRVRMDCEIEMPSTIEICGRISGFSDKPGPLLVEKFTAVRRALLLALGRS